MYHLVNNLQSTAGDALQSYFVKLRDAAGSYVTLYADGNGTPISSVSGVADTALTDDDGMFDIYVEDGLYDIVFFDAADSTQLVETIPQVPMFSYDTTVLDSKVTTATDAADAAEASATTASEAADTAASAASDAAAAASVAQASAGAAIEASWSILSGITGSPGDSAVVFEDAGTHTDPVVGGTVDNAGIYTWSASPAGWQRVADTEAVKAQAWAEGTLPGGVGTFSAKEYSETAASAASDAADALAGINTSLDTYSQGVVAQVQVNAALSARASGYTTMPTPPELALTIPRTGQRGELAVFEYNPGDGFYWGDSRSHATSGDFQTYMGGSTAGGVITFGPYVDTTVNLIPNHTLTNTTSWVGSTGVTLSAVSDTDGGTVQALNIAAVSAANPVGYINLNIPTDAEYQAVQINMRIRRVDSSGTIRSGASVGASTALSQYSGANTAGTSYVAAQFYAAAHEGDSNAGPLHVGARTTGTVTMQFRISSVGLSAYYAYPFKGFPQGPSYHFLRFQTGPAGSGAETAIEFGNDGRGWVRVKRDKATGAMTLEVKGAGTVWSGGLALGTVAASQVNQTLAFRIKPDGVAASLNGGKAVNLVNVSIDGAWKARIGGDADGNTWSGDVKQWAIWAGECEDAWLEFEAGDREGIVVFGDSFTVRLATADSLSFCDKLATVSGRPVARYGVGETTPREQLKRFMDSPGVWDATIVWQDGGLGNIADPNLSMMCFRQARQIAGHDRNLFMPGVAGAPATAGAPTTNEAIQRDRADTLTEMMSEDMAASGTDNDEDRYLDPAPIWDALSTGSANDVANLAAGFRPESCFEADKIHPTATTRDAMVTAVWAQIQLIEA